MTWNGETLGADPPEEKPEGPPEETPEESPEETQEETQEEKAGPTAEEKLIMKMDTADIKLAQHVYFIRGTGISIRLQKGPISAKRGQNGITKKQLSLIARHAGRRKDV